MIFAVATDEQTLHVFDDEAAAVSYCEGIDVEAAVWLFWDDTGEPLVPEFITPNKRGMFSVASGKYRLTKRDSVHHADLLEALKHIVAVEGQPPMNSVADVQRYLTLVRNES